MNLLNQSLWRDEAFSAILASHNPIEIIRLSAGDATPPLYYLLLHYWTSLFGDSEVALRAMGVLFLIGAAAVFYMIGKEKNVLTGWYMAALTLTQPILFYYAFEVRAYILLIFLSALTIYFYLRKSRILTAVSAIALLYTHLFGIFTVAILFAWSVYKKESNRWLILTLVAYLPWLPNYWQLAQASSLPKFESFAVQNFFLATLPILAVAPVIKRVIADKLFLLSYLLWAGPLAAFLLISPWVNLLQERFLIVAIPGQLLLLGLAYRGLGKRLAHLVLAGQVLLSWQLFTHPGRPPFRELASFVQSKVESGDIILNASALTYFESRYYGLSAPIYSPNQNIPYYVGKVLINPSDVLTSLPSAERFFIISLDESGGKLEEPFPTEHLEKYEFGRLKIDIYAGNSF